MSPTGSLIFTPKGRNTILLNAAVNAPWPNESFDVAGKVHMYTSVLVNIHGRLELNSWVYAKCICRTPQKDRTLL